MFNHQEFAPFAALDLEPIKFKLMHPDAGEGWSAEKTESVEAEYRRFLFLMKKFPQEATAPAHAVDTFWHYHILDTMKYAADCEALFGYFLHHFPYIGLRGADDAAALERIGARMGELYQATFGETYLAGAAAWCGAANAPAEAAWCGAATNGEAKAAWCGAATNGEAKAAWCGAATNVEAKTAWCGAATNGEAKAAWCGATNAEAKAAWCGAANTEAKAAWCGASSPEAKAAWCGAANAQASAAWCGAATQAPEHSSTFYTARPAPAKAAA